MGATPTWTKEDAARIVGMRQRGYKWERIARECHFTVWTARQIAKQVAPELFERKPKKASGDMQVGSYGDLWDDPEDYLRLLSAEARKGLEKLRAKL